MTKPDCCAIAVVLDRSGSMASIRQATIEGFNEFLKGQQAAPGEATLTLVQFDNEYEVHHDAAPLASVAPLNDRTYEPRGTTALLDAIGRTIDDLGKRLAVMAEHDRPSRVLVAIMTDGYENASRIYTYQRIAEMIAHQQQKYGWEFVFMGANQDAIAEAARMGIDRGRAATWHSTDRSAKGSMGVLSAKLAFSRSSGSAFEDFTDQERQAIRGEDTDADAPSQQRPQRRTGNRMRKHFSSPPPSSSPGANPASPPSSPSS